MTSFGINLQWSRRNALMAKDILPEDVIEELKPLLRLSKTDAGPYIYKTLKEEILTLFAPKEENAYEKAAARRLTTRPSALGKLLINDICPGVKPFENCHCARGVYYFFMLQMPQVIKTALADKKFNAQTYKDVFKLADDVFNANKLGSATAVVAAVTADADTTLPALQYPVEAVTSKPTRGGRGGRGGRGRGGNRGGRGANQTSTSNASPPAAAENKNQTNETLPPNLCFVHKKYKKQANHCRNPFVCEWAKHVVPRSN